MYNFEVMENDEQVVLLYRESRDKKLLGQLLKQYKTNLFGLAYYYLNDKDIAMDVVMETYEVAIINILNKDITYFKGWLLSICRNISLKKIRDRKTFSHLSEISDIFVEKDVTTVYTDDNIQKLREALTQLKDNQRKCVEAFYFNNLSYKEIAESTDMTIKEVKSNLQNGKRNLKILLDKDS